MKNFVLGVCVGTVGVAILSSASDLIVTAVELLKARMCVEITKCNVQINSLTESEPETIETRAIGFATIDAEEEELW